MWLIAVLAVAPCQCFSPAGIQTISPGRISSMGHPSRCTQPAPKVTISVWPSGCVCHAVRAPGSKVTTAPLTRAGPVPWKGWSMRTVPVKYSAGPRADACEPFLFISMYFLPATKQSASGHLESSLGQSFTLYLNLGSLYVDLLKIVLR